MQLIGIIGGMGPQATVMLMQRIIDLTPAQRDADHIPLLVCSDPRIPDRTAAARGTGPSPLSALIQAGRRLKAAGADGLAMACNTAHIYHAELAAELGLPFIHLIEEVAGALAAKFPGGARVGILATDGTIGSGLYPPILAARGMETVLPDTADQARVMETIYGRRGVKAGHITPEQARELSRVIARLHARGAQAAVAGCTEIPPVLEAFKPALPVPVICSIDVLARAILRHAGLAHAPPQA